MATDPTQTDLGIGRPVTAGGGSSLVQAYCADAEKLLLQDRFQEARAVIKQALQLAPNDAAAVNVLGVIEMGSGNLEEAARVIRRATKLDPAAPEPLYYLGLAHTRLGRHEDAALALNPSLGPAHAELCSALLTLGRREEAKDTLRQIMTLDPDEVSAYEELAQIEPTALTAENLTWLDAIARDTGQDPMRRSIACFALAEVHEASGDHDTTFNYLKRANDLHSELLTKNQGKSVPRPAAAANPSPHLRAPADVLAQLVNLASFAETTFSADFLRRYEGAGHPSNLPIFIVGMPRSGSSLIEQILSSHSWVHGAGEVDLFRAQAVQMQWPYKGYLRRDGDGVVRPTEPPARHFRARGAAYVKALRGLNSRARRIVDKTPINYLHIGMIHLCLPNAIIVHSVRDPVDTCLGCYKRRFSHGNETSYDLTMIGHHYVQYRKVMAHWQRVLPGRVVDLVYERLVAEPEKEVRGLLEACGLPWEDACLRFYENKRPVQTSSLTQVRQPIYRSALNRWRRYEKHLGPLLDALGPYAPAPAQADSPNPSQ
jgi:tetratricopeptide (TPR) repeat protein